MKLYSLSMACINASILVAVCYSMDAMNATMRHCGANGFAKVDARGAIPPGRKELSMLLPLRVTKQSGSADSFWSYF